MAHDLNITNGIASFASAREHAWHRLGTVLPSAMTAEQALDAAHLARWNVRKMPLYLHEPVELTPNGVYAPDPIVVPSKFATVRTNPVSGATEPLGVVGESYTVIQNEEHADLLNTLVDESGAHFEAAGALDGGRQIFLSMKLPKTMAVQGHSGEDVTDVYLVASNSHDGSSAFRIMVTPVRVVCANTLSAAVRGARAQFSIRHTRNAASNIQIAREALGLTWKYMEEFEREAQLMTARDLDVSTAEIVLKEVFRYTDKNQTERMLDNQRRRLSDVITIWNDAPTNENLRGTAYGLYNAVAEYVDHFMPVQGGTDVRTLRAERVVRGGESMRLKEASFTNLAKLAGV